MVKHAEWITGWDYGQDVCLINYQRSDGRRDMNRKIRIETTNCIITTHWSLLIIFPDLLNYVSAVKTKRWGECKCLSTSYPVTTSHSSLFSFHIPVTHIKIQIYSNNRFAWKIANCRQSFINQSSRRWFETSREDFQPPKSSRHQLGVC